MADRSRLHITKLEDFKKWLIKDGWVIEEPKGTWEVLRARKENRRNPLIVYCKMNAKEHLSVMDRDSGVIGAFLRDSKKPQTNADIIRSMSDEELAEFLIKQHACDNCEYFGGGSRCKAPNEFKCTNEYATAVVQKWLQSEVKGSE